MSSHEHAHPEYLSYLLRLWHTQSGGDPVWRVALEDPLTQEVVRFDNLPGLFAFLRTQTGAGTAKDPAAVTPPQDDEGSMSV
jgi:hypothetical protein